MTNSLPNGGLQIRSTVTAEGAVEIELVEAPAAAPGDDQLVLRVEAAPINPSDLVVLLAGADPVQAEFGGSADRPKVTARLSPQALEALAGRVGQPLPVGLEGAGEVVAAGKDGQGLVGKRVAFLSMAMGSLGQYCTISMNDCMPLPDGVSAVEGAHLFCNPLTALAMVETLRQTGQTAMIHTAAASNLGQMLVRICQEDGVPLVNVVRRQEHAELLRGLGADHVCVSSAPTFRADLAAAAAATGATVAFDAIGGGLMASELLTAMEWAAVGRMLEYSPYGSAEYTCVYNYGHLDASAVQLPLGGYGMLWGVEGWAMPPILERAGAERAMELTQRVADNLTTTFASHYGSEISLAQVLQRDVMLGYCRQATGQKVLVRPWA